MKLRILFLAPLLVINVIAFSQKVGDPVKWIVNNQWKDVYEGSIVEVKDTLYLIDLDKFDKNEWVGKSNLQFLKATKYTPSLGETVIAFSPQDNGWFDASVKEIKDGKFFVHYSGYSSQYDTWVDQSQIKAKCPDLSYKNNHIKLVPDALTLVNKTKREGEKMLYVVVLDNDWTLVKNSVGIILRRTLKGKAIAQNTTSNLCFEIDLVFSQENISSGGSKYAPTQWTRQGSYEDSPHFSVDCLK